MRMHGETTLRLYKVLVESSQAPEALEWRVVLCTDVECIKRLQRAMLGSTARTRAMRSDLCALHNN
jgi:hypothetical protein